MDSPYTVIVDGVPVQCETAEAALALVRLHGGNAASGSPVRATQRGHSQPNGTRWTDQRIAAFFKLIEGKQLKLIDALLEFEDGRTDAQVVQLLGLSSGSALGGVFAGLWKNAKKVGADPAQLYIRKPINIGDKKGYEYTLNEGFREAATRRPK
jgi:hypothetical protein